MKRKPLVPRAKAHTDIDAALTYYALQAGAETAYGFIAAIQDALRSIGDYPAIGSLSYARTVKVAGLRSRLSLPDFLSRVRIGSKSGASSTRSAISPRSCGVPQPSSMRKAAAPSPIDARRRRA